MKQPASTGGLRLYKHGGETTSPPTLSSLLGEIFFIYIKKKNKHIYHEPPGCWDKSLFWVGGCTIKFFEKFQRIVFSFEKGGKH